MTDSHPTRVLHPEPLTAAAFAPFGEVIDAGADPDPKTINDGYARRHDDLARIDTDADGGRARVSVFRATPRELPLALRSMERHPLGTQAFVPLGAAPWLVVVAPAGDAPGVDAIRCFRPAPGQGVNVARGVWHHPLIALEGGGEFLVIDRRPAEGEAPAIDCDVHVLPAGAVSVSLGDGARESAGDVATRAKHLVEEFLRVVMIPDPVGARAFTAPDIRIAFTGGRAMTDPGDTSAFNAKRYAWVKKRLGPTHVGTGATEAEAVVYNTGTLHGAWPDGTPFEGNRYVDRYVVRHGRIAEMAVWNDSAEWLLVRAGLAEPWPSPMADAANAARPAKRR